MNKTIILTSIITAVLTAILTTAGILGTALYIKDHQTQQSQSEQTPQAQAETPSPSAEPAPEQTKPAEQPAEAPAVAEAADQAQQTVKLPISRDAFDALVTGKSKADVIRLVGKPDRTYSGEVEDIWTWEHATYDPVTNKPDTSTKIDFINGVAQDATHS